MGNQSLLSLVLVVVLLLTVLPHHLQLLLVRLRPNSKRETAKWQRTKGIVPCIRHQVTLMGLLLDHTARNNNSSNNNNGCSINKCTKRNYPPWA